MSKLNESFESFVGEVLNSTINLDLVKRGIKVPRVIQSYRDDFGGSDKKILQFIYNKTLNDEWLTYFFSHYYSYVH